MLALHGRRFRRYVEVARASAHHGYGMDACIRRVRTPSLSVRRMRSAFPFCSEVYGHVRRRRVPCLVKRARFAVLSNSRPLSVLRYNAYSESQKLDLQIYVPMNYSVASLFSDIGIAKYFG
jgi:hypothetical protein